MGLAHEYADFSRDPRTKVGCTLVSIDHDGIVARGCNNFARGIDDSIVARWEAPLKYKYVVHAELNAITEAARRGVSTQGATCVQTLYPCANCCLAMIQAGITAVVTYKPDFTDLKWGQDWTFARSLFEEAGVTVKFLDD
jgi:dCMP deaminase